MLEFGGVLGFTGLVGVVEFDACLSILAKKFQGNKRTIGEVIPSETN